MLRRRELHALCLTFKLFNQGFIRSFLGICFIFFLVWFQAPRVMDCWWVVSDPLKSFISSKSSFTLALLKLIWILLKFNFRGLFTLQDLLSISKHRLLLHLLLFFSFLFSLDRDLLHQQKGLILNRLNLLLYLSFLFHPLLHRCSRGFVLRLFRVVSFINSGLWADVATSLLVNNVCSWLALHWFVHPGRSKLSHALDCVFTRQLHLNPFFEVVFITIVVKWFVGLLCYSIVKSVGKVEELICGFSFVFRLNRLALQVARDTLVSDPLIFGLSYDLLAIKTVRCPIVGTVSQWLFLSYSGTSCRQQINLGGGFFEFLVALVRQRIQDIWSVTLAGDLSWIESWPDDAVDIFAFLIYLFVSNFIFEFDNLVDVCVLMHIWLLFLAPLLSLL